MVHSDGTSPMSEHCPTASNRCSQVIMLARFVIIGVFRPSRRVCQDRENHATRCTTWHPGQTTDYPGLQRVSSFFGTCFILPMGGFDTTCQDVGRVILGANLSRLTLECNLTRSCFSCGQTNSRRRAKHSERGYNQRINKRLEALAVVACCRRPANRFESLVRNPLP
jgi:hypothetical protein